MHPRTRKSHHRIRPFKSFLSTYDEPQTPSFDRRPKPFPMVMTRGRPWIFHRSTPSRSLQRALFFAHTASTQLFHSSLKSSQRDLRSHVQLTSSTSSKCFRAIAPLSEIGLSSPSEPKNGQTESCPCRHNMYMTRKSRRSSLRSQIFTFGDDLCVENDAPTLAFCALSSRRADSIIGDWRQIGVKKTTSRPRMAMIFSSGES